MNRLKEIREDRDITQAKIADHLGVHFTTVSKWELGKVQLTEDLIHKFCDFYGVTADYLLCRSNYPRAVVSEPDTALLAAYHAAPAEIRVIVDTALAPYAEENKKDASAAS